MSTTPTPTITPTASPILTTCSIYNLTVTGAGPTGIFEYYYDICLTNSCEQQLTSYGVISDFPVSIDFCANYDSVVFPPQYTEYSLTLICQMCCNCCDKVEVPTYSPSPTPSITPTLTPTPSITPI